MKLDLAEHPPRQTNAPPPDRKTRPPCPTRRKRAAAVLQPDRDQRGIIDQDGRQLRKLGPVTA
jgi:hypothetical protein